MPYLKKIDICFEIAFTEKTKLFDAPNNLKDVILYAQNHKFHLKSVYFLHKKSVFLLNTNRTCVNSEFFLGFELFQFLSCFFL